MLPASTAYSPDEGVTSGSQSVSEGGKALRLACAEARGERRPEPGARVVGTSAPRRDLPGKFAGRPSYVHDMVLPGMLHGRVVRPTHGFSRLISLGDVKATVVRDGSFVGVLAEREEDAIAAAAKLRAKSTWEPSAPVPDDIHAWLKQHVTERIVSKEGQERSSKRAQAARLVHEALHRARVHRSLLRARALDRRQARGLDAQPGHLQPAPGPVQGAAHEGRGHRGHARGRRGLLRPQRRRRCRARCRAASARGRRPAGATAVDARRRIRLGALRRGDGLRARGRARRLRRDRLLAPRVLEQRPHAPAGPGGAAGDDRRRAPRRAVRDRARGQSRAARGRRRPQRACPATTSPTCGW